jgi:hypothetical protein
MGIKKFFLYRTRTYGYLDMCQSLFSLLGTTGTADLQVCSQQIQYWYCTIHLQLVSTEKYAYPFHVAKMLSSASIRIDSIMATLASEIFQYPAIYVQSDVEAWRPRSSWLIVLSSGCFPHPHRFVKSSKSRAQIIPPPRSIFLMYCDCNKEYEVSSNAAVWADLHIAELNTSPLIWLDS